ncbi:hypothetical protein BHE74_00034464 [Ensete ventricosum]|nr:hypothetical protein GW17_00057289 [Ensete ventricosum]RWW58663.1 hypothetical protein BHE74_00034464 [Ensete ventricosum]RZR95678.1 hypothetical protein BHM03_00024544 [Ensete ventricosum]
MERRKGVQLLVLFRLLSLAACVDRSHFPPSFLFGTSTSSYQVRKVFRLTVTCPLMSSGYPQGSDHNTSVKDLLNDKDRVEYLRSYLSSLYKAIRYI